MAAGKVLCSLNGAIFSMCLFSVCCPLSVAKHVAQLTQRQQGKEIHFDAYLKTINDITYFGNFFYFLQEYNCAIAECKVYGGGRRRQILNQRSKLEYVGLCSTHALEVRRGREKEKFEIGHQQEMKLLGLVYTCKANR